MFRYIVQAIKNTIHIYKYTIQMNVSETSRCRERLKKYCVGNGVDLGSGGDPITPEAINVDLPRPYTKVGDFPIHLKGDARNLYWFKDETLDYVYSSHLLEDFVDTKEVLEEWLRVIKKGGYLVLYCPVEKIYRKHCQNTGQPYNLSHKIENFNLDYVLNILSKIAKIKVIYSSPLCEEYSFEIVIQKL